MASVSLRTGAHVIGVRDQQFWTMRGKAKLNPFPEPGVNDPVREGMSSGRFTIYNNLNLCLP